MSTPLCEIMAKHGSDKGPPQKHTYTHVYHRLFSEIRNDPLRVFEIGLGTTFADVPSNMSSMPKTYRPGASVRAWAEYFTKSQILGADFDKRILFTEPRITTVWCDQTDPVSIKSMWARPDFSEPCDIIIDDALHTFDANLCFMLNSIERTRKFYIVEDVSWDDLRKWKLKIMDWYHEGRFRNFSFSFYESSKTSINDDNMVIVQRNWDFKNSPFHSVVSLHWEHIEQLSNIMKTTFEKWKGCGSYMSNGQTADYEWAFFHKQELFWRIFSELSGEKIKFLEIGIHGAQSLLLALTAQPYLKITAIDPCIWEHTQKCIDYLQENFPEADINLIQDKSQQILPTLEPDNWDIIHIDGSHGYHNFKIDLEWSLIHSPKVIILDDIDAEGIDLAIREYHIPLTAKSPFPYRNGFWKLPQIKVRFVTAFFTIGDTRGVDIYLKNAKTLFTYTPMVNWTLFTDRSEPLEWGFPNVEVVSMQLADLKIAEDTNLELPKSRNKDKDTLNYYRVQLSKFLLVNKAFESFDYEETTIAWMDFGILKNPGASPQTMGALISRVAHLDIDGCYFPGFRLPTEIKSDVYDRIIWSFAGTFFVVEATSFSKLFEIYEKRVEEMLSAGRITWEINLWHDIAAKHPGIIKYYDCDKAGSHKNGLLTGLLKHLYKT